jgi:hypothetical protein
METANRSQTAGVGGVRDRGALVITPPVEGNAYKAEHRYPFCKLAGERIEARRERYPKRDAERDKDCCPRPINVLDRLPAILSVYGEYGNRQSKPSSKKCILFHPTHRSFSLTVLACHEPC